MAQSKIVLRSLAELAQLLDDVPPITEAEAGAETAPADEQAVEANAAMLAQATAPPPDLHALLAELQAASDDLTLAMERDQEARTAALGRLEAYDALVGRQREAEEALRRATQVRLDAETLSTAAFTDEARAAAIGIAQMAARAEAGAAQLVTQRQEEADRLLVVPALQRLLEERRQAEVRKDAEAAEAERARRLQDGLAAVRDALTAGRLSEAEAMLGPLAKDHPDSADISSLQDILHHRMNVVKIAAAEEALRAARRAYRQTPAEAVAGLEGLDLQDLPQELLHQIKGVWAAACARLCQVRGIGAPLLRYLPAPAHGLVVAREAEGCYRVVSALGARDWSTGSAVPETFLRQARPLRASGH